MGTEYSKETNRREKMSIRWRLMVLKNDSFSKLMCIITILLQFICALIGGFTIRINESSDPMDYYISLCATVVAIYAVSVTVYVFLESRLYSRSDASTKVERPVRDAYFTAIRKNLLTITLSAAVFIVFCSLAMLIVTNGYHLCPNVRRMIRGMLLTYALGFIFVNCIFYFWAICSERYTASMAARIVSKHYPINQELSDKYETLQKVEVLLCAMIGKQRAGEDIVVEYSDLPSVRRILSGKIECRDDQQVQGSPIITDELFHENVRHMVRVYSALTMITSLGPKDIKRFNYLESSHTCKDNSCESKYCCLSKPEDFFNTMNMKGLNMSRIDLNGWRFSIQGESIEKDVKRRDMESCNFSRSTLADVDFRRVLLKRSVFSECVLSGVSFQEADCSGANFSGSSITGWHDENKSKSMGGIFKEAILDDALFKGSNLKGLAMDTDLRGVSFEDGNLSKVKFSNEISMCNFSRSKLYDSIIGNDDVASVLFITDTSFEKSQISRSWLKNLEMFGIQMAGAEVISARIKSVRIVASDLRRTDFSSSNMMDFQLSNCDANGSIFRNAEIARCVFQHTRMSNAVFSVKSMTDTRFVGSIVSDSQFSLMQFDNCELRDTIFSNSVFNVVRFDNKTKIDNCDMRDIRMVDVIFDGTEISNSNFDSTMFLNVKFRNVNFIDVRFGDGNSAPKGEIFENCSFRNTNI